MSIHEFDLLVSAAVTAWDFCGSMVDAIRDAARDENISLSDDDFDLVIVAAHDRIVAENLRIEHYS